MKMKRLISTGLAAVALAVATLPAFAYDGWRNYGFDWPDINFEWYANVGRPLTTTPEEMHAPRAGYIWAPGRWENQGSNPAWVAGHWIKDDFKEQIAALQRQDQLAAAQPQDAAQAKP